MHLTFDSPEGAGGGLAQLLQLHPQHQALGTVQTTGFSLQQQDPDSLSTQLQFRQGSSHHGKRCSAAQSLPAGDTIAQGKLLHGQGCSSAQSLPARDTIAQGKLSHQPGMLSSTVSTCQRHIAHRQPCSSIANANPTPGRRAQLRDAEPKSRIWGVPQVCLQQPHGWDNLQIGEQ